MAHSEDVSDRQTNRYKLTQCNATHRNGPPTTRVSYRIGWVAVEVNKRGKREERDGGGGGGGGWKKKNSAGAAFYIVKCVQ